MFEFGLALRGTDSSQLRASPSIGVGEQPALPGPASLHLAVGALPPDCIGKVS